MLEEIATADYGFDQFEHATALENIVVSGDISDPLEWHPREVLNLIRWSEPDLPGRSPGASGRDGHVMRAFACTVLLVAGGLPEGYEYVDGESETLVQLLGSALELGPEWAAPAASLIYSRLLDGPLDGDNRPFFVLGLLLLLRLGGAFEPTQEQWCVLATWLNDSEMEARLSSRRPDSGCWLLDLTPSALNMDSWKALSRKAFGLPGPSGAELIVDKIAAWPTTA